MDGCLRNRNPELRGPTLEDSEAGSRFSSVACDFTVRLCRLSCGRLLDLNCGARSQPPSGKRFLFHDSAPGSVLVLIPSWMLGGFRRPVGGPLTWLGAVAIPAGAAIYFRRAWEFAARGWYTPAPIAPTKFPVTTALHRYVRHPMYIGVFGVLRGEGATFRAVIATIKWLFGQYMLPQREEEEGEEGQCHRKIR